MIYLGPKWAGNWASEADIHHTSKSSSNWHANQDWCKTAGKRLRKWPNTCIFTYFRAQSGPEIWPTGRGPFLHMPESTHSVPVNQVSWSRIKTFLRKLPKTSKIPHFYFFLVIKDPLRNLKQQIKILLPQLLGQYPTVVHIQISERSYEKREPIYSAIWKKVDDRRTEDGRLSSGANKSPSSLSDPMCRSCLMITCRHQQPHGRGPIEL